LLYYKFSKVCVSDVVPARIQLSKEFGSQGESVEDGTADFVLEVCGVPQVVPNGIKALRVGGVYSLAGLVHPRSVLVGVTGEAIIRKCLTLQGTHNYDDESLEEAIRILNWAHTEKKFPLEKLVSSPIPLEKLDSAFVEAATQKWMRVSVIPPTQISKL
jgi:threonine dehydrogenase-like Zn-dependent dehydrogenase